MRKQILRLAGYAIIMAALVIPGINPAIADELVGPPAPKADNTLKSGLADSFIVTANQHMTNGRFKQAADDFTTALKFSPDNEDALKGLTEARARMAEPVAQKEVTAQDLAAQAGRDQAIRVQAELASRALFAKKALESGDYETAQLEYKEVLSGLDQIATRVDVAKMRTEAQQGLRAAKNALREQEEQPARLDPKSEKENEQAFDDAMRDIAKMMKPETKIITKSNLPDTMKDFQSTAKKHGVDEITKKTFQEVEDEDSSLAIHAQLLKRVSVEFKNQPFSDAIEHLRSISQINILVDPEILANTTPVDFTVSNMELRNVIDWILRFQRLEYRIRDGAIYISNEAGLAQKPVTKSYDVSDLVVKMRDFNRSMVEVMEIPEYDRKKQGDFGTDSMKVQENRSEEEGQNLADFIKKNISPKTWSGEGLVADYTIAYRNGKLVVTHTPDVQERIEDLLSSFRRARAIQVAILARFIEINEDFLDELSIDWTGLGSDNDLGFVDSGGNALNVRGSITPTHEVPLGTRFLNPAGLNTTIALMRGWEVQAIISAVRKQKKGNILTAPRVTCFNTQRAFLTVSTRRNFVRSYDSDGNPEIGQVNDGIVLEVQPFVSADRRYITLELIPQVNKVGQFDEFQFRRDNDDPVDPNDPNNGQSTTDTVQLPQVTTRQVMTTVSVPDGGTLMVGGLAEATEASGYGTVPFLGDLPLIKYLFRSRRKVDSRNNLIVLVTAHIIQQDED